MKKVLNIFKKYIAFFASSKPPKNAIFLALASSQKMACIFCDYGVVLDRPPSDLYITYSV